MSKHFILITKVKKDNDCSPDSPFCLKSKSKHTCTVHPKRDAYCLCAKCGALICENCCQCVAGRRYCENCLIHDDELIEAQQQEVLKLGERSSTENALAQNEAPQKITDLPRAFLNICADSFTFFMTAKDSPFLMTYLLALIAVLPANISSILLHYDELCKVYESSAELYAMASSIPVEIRVSGAVLYSIIQIIILDLLYFACVRGISHAKMSFKETSSVFHYCALPLIFTGLGTAYSIPMISFIGLCLMILMLTTAVRASTRCTFWQGTGIMLLFILLGTLTKVLSFYGI